MKKLDGLRAKMHSGVCPEGFKIEYALLCHQGEGWEEALSPCRSGPLGSPSFEGSRTQAGECVLKLGESWGRGGLLLLIKSRGKYFFHGLYGGGTCMPHCRVITLLQ